MQDRQADIHEATMAGNPQEVARLCRVMGTAATDWSTPRTLPSICSAVKARDSMFGLRGVRVGEAWARHIVAVLDETQSPRRRAITVSTRRRTVRTTLKSFNCCGEASHPGPPRFSVLTGARGGVERSRSRLDQN